MNLQIVHLIQIGMAVFVHVASVRDVNRNMDQHPSLWGTVKISRARNDRGVPVQHSFFFNSFHSCDSQRAGTALLHYLFRSRVDRGLVAFGRSVFELQRLLPLGRH